MVTAATIWIRTTIMPYPLKKPLELCYKNRKEQHHTSLSSCNSERNAEKICYYYYREKRSRHLLHDTLRARSLLHFVHSARRSTGSPVGKGAFLSTLYLNTSL